MAAAVATFPLRIRGDLRGETLLLLTRRECVPCQEARRLLESWSEEMGYGLWVVDIDTAGAQVRDEYSARVPVVLHRGRVVAELDAHAETMQAALHRL